MKYILHTLHTSLAVALLSMAGSAQAAILSPGSFQSNFDNSSPENIPGGLLDWKLWEGDDNPTTPNPVPVYNEKAGASLIGSMTASVDDLTDGSGTGSWLSRANPSWTFNYTDGSVSSTAATTAESPTSDLGLSLRGTLDDINDADDYLRFSITTDAIRQYTVNLYGGNRRSGTEITLQLPGVSDVTNSLTVNSGTDDTELEPWIYTTTFTPDSIGDALTITLRSDGTSTEPGHSSNTVRFTGVTVIPEPSSMVLFALGVGSVLCALKSRLRSR